VSSQSHRLDADGRRNGEREPRMPDAGHGSDDGLSLDLLDALFREAPLGLALWDTELRYVRVNETLAEINGASVEEHIGRPIGEVLPRLGPALTERLRSVMVTGTALRDVEVIGETPAAPGIERVWRASYFAVREPDGRTVGLAGVVIEITDHAGPSARRRSWRRPAANS
jgi:PAS domain S-box-containing protein